MLAPNHKLILADFDDFRYPVRGRVPGGNAPIVANKLEGATSWKNYNSIIIPRGAADICFPVDF